MIYIKLLLIILYTLLISVFAIISVFIDRSFTVYFWVSKIYSAGILAITGIKVEITGLENIDKNSNYVYVANHSSQFDITALQYSIPNRMSMIFKRELSRIPFFGWALKMGPYVMIDRKSIEGALKGIEKAKRIMRDKNYSIVVFAEGTRSLTGEVQPFKRGAFHLAAKVGYPIIPTSIVGTNKIMPKGELKINKGTIYVHFGAPISTDMVKSKQDELKLMKQVRETIIKNINQNSK